jgi:hypothetical protein
VRARFNSFEFDAYCQNGGRCISFKDSGNNQDRLKPESKPRLVFFTMASAEDSSSIAGMSSAGRNVHNVFTVHNKENEKNVED